MRPLALIVACIIPLGVLLAGCGGGSSCNVRADVCGGATSTSGGDMGDPNEDERLHEYFTEQQEYWVQRQEENDDSLRQESYDEVDNDSDVEESLDPRANESRGMKKQWYHNIDMTKFRLDAGQISMRRV